MVITQRQFNEAMEQINKAFAEQAEKTAKLQERIEKLESAKEPRKVLSKNG